MNTKQKNIRNDFYLLKHNKVVYFDNAASALKPKQVAKTINNYYTKLGTNSSRGVYKLAYEVTTLYEDSRESVAKFLNCESREVVFTKGATNSLNIVATSYGLNNLKAGDEIITSKLEHHSSILPWVEVAKKTGAVLKYVPLDKHSRITVENFKSVCTNKTKIVALTHMSNVMGYLTPVKEICKIAHSFNAITIIDGAQSVPHLKIDVKDLDCDFFAFSAHKICGPTGVGVLYGKFDLLNNMIPVEVGGGMIEDVVNGEPTYKKAPFKFEAGTPIIAGVIGLKTAIDYINNVGYDFIYKTSKELKDYLFARLKELKNITIYNDDTDIPLVAFNIDGIHSHDAASVYDNYNICVRAGHHCAKPLMDYLGQIATLRVSLYYYNTKEEIDKFIEVTKAVQEFFNKN